MKLKALVAAVALVAAGAANAAITPDGNGGTSLIFEAWDTVSNQGYAVNLGKTFDQFLASPSTTISAQISSSDLASLLGADTSGSALNWHVFALKQTGTVAFPTDGFLTTIAPGGMPIAAFDSFALPTLEGATNVHVNDLIAALSGANSGLIASSAVAYPGSNGTDYAGFLLGGASAKTGYGSLDFYNIDNVGDPLAFNKLSTASLSSTGGILLGAPAAVPLPAAAWLFGSGVLGLVGIARRRFNAA